MAEEIFRKRENLGVARNFCRFTAGQPVSGKNFLYGAVGRLQHRKFFLFKHGIFDRRRPRRMWRRTDAGYLILSGNRAIVKRCRIKCTERKSPVYAPMKEGCVLQAAEIPTVSYRKNHRRGKAGL